ncbi:MULTISPECIES: hypothetical protein [Nosocomiicoccus]|uniref:Uncharacterized protein n=1 Tax=Nosocomiicoccus massiliensis TaxID=1232430 RepID=A0AAF0YHJ7_9STAP|nr:MULTISPECIES: hypothetical protein [Nosocomiicoccus]OFL47548.1 hypothetical protein HMPREF2767_02365 [Nosocomiicoccus sp. HMSC067E10]OFO52983.1 hypothetical protein HMPREF3029_01815 [Nosocomiicoccus sp. HMSC059G07]WOS96028.1 hypothetical protein CJ229_008065 [Nosocomiicoccus massiliensis]
MGINLKDYINRDNINLSEEKIRKHLIDILNLSDNDFFILDIDLERIDVSSRIKDITNSQMHEEEPINIPFDQITPRKTYELRLEGSMFNYYNQGLIA